MLEIDTRFSPSGPLTSLTSYTCGLARFVVLPVVRGLDGATNITPLNLQLHHIYKEL